MYGFTKARTKWLPLDGELRPPFVEQWSVTGRILLEFTPVLCGRSLFLLKNNGALYAVARLTGRRALEAQARLPGRLVAGLRPTAPCTR